MWIDLKGWGEMKVYIVMNYNTATREKGIEAIFQTKQKAEEYTKTAALECFEEFYIKEYDVR